MTKRTKTLTLLAVVASLGVGCSDTDKHHDRSSDKDRDGIPNRADPHPNRPDLPAGDVRYDGDRVGMRGIPRDAIRLEKDEGPEMRVRPNQDGRIFVYDPRADRIAYEGRLRAKEEFIAIPDRDSITIDGKRVDSARLSGRERYQLYFLRD
jgi:hypothetical protein